MNKKLLITLSGLSILSGMVLLIMKNIPSFYNEEMKLSVLLNDVKSLKVNDGIMIVRKDGIWCSRDDDYYPVNNQMVDELVASLQNAALHAEKNNANVEGKDKIVLSAGDGEKISLFFDEEAGKTDRITVLYNEQNEVLNGIFAVPAQPYQWFVQPLIKLNDTDVEEISGIEPQDFSFDDLIFYQVTQKNDFEDWASKNIRIEMRNGIIIRLTVLTRNHSYWVNVVLDTSVMPTVEAYEFVKNNGFLYDGWYFELPQPVGSRLFGL